MIEPKAPTWVMQTHKPLLRGFWPFVSQMLLQLVVNRCVIGGHHGYAF